MLEKIYHKSEMWFSVMLIALYVIGNSYLLQASIHTGIEMIYTIPFNCILFVTMFRFIRKNQLSDSFGLRKPQCQGKTVLYYIPLIMIASVNLWMGVTMKMDALHSIIYFIAMLLTGSVEEMLFRGFLFQAMAKDDMKSAVIVTSILFGLGHIINLQCFKQFPVIFTAGLPKENVVHQCVSDIQKYQKKYCMNISVDIVSAFFT